MDGNSYVRVDAPCGAIRDLLPDIAGSDGSRLVLHGRGTPVGPPAGSTRYQARWNVGRASGLAGVLVMPVADWGSEVHLMLRAPRSLAGLVLWRRRRLATLAAGLAIAIRGSARPLARERAYTRTKRELVRTRPRPTATTSA